MRSTSSLMAGKRAKTVGGARQVIAPTIAARERALELRAIYTLKPPYPRADAVTLLLGDDADAGAQMTDWPYMQGEEGFIAALAMNGALMWVDAPNSKIFQAQYAVLLAVPLPAEWGNDDVFCVTFNYGAPLAPIVTKRAALDTMADLKQVLNAVQHPAAHHVLGAPVRASINHAVGGRTIIEVRVNVQRDPAVAVPLPKALALDRRVETFEPSMHTALLEAQLLVHKRAAVIKYVPPGRGGAPAELIVEVRKLPVIHAAHMSALTERLPPADFDDSVYVVDASTHLTPCQAEAYKSMMLVESNASCVTDALAVTSMNPYVRIVGTGYNAALCSDAMVGMDVTGGIVVAERGTGAATLFAALNATRPCRTVVLCDDQRVPAWRHALGAQGVDVNTEGPSCVFVFPWSQHQILPGFYLKIRRATRIIVDCSAARQVLASNAFRNAASAVPQRWLLFTSMAAADNVLLQGPVFQFFSINSPIYERVGVETKPQTQVLPCINLERGRAGAVTTKFFEVSQAADAAIVTWLMTRTQIQFNPSRGNFNSDMLLPLRNTTCGAPMTKKMMLDAFRMSAADGQRVAYAPDANNPGACLTCNADLVLGNAVAPLACCNGNALYCGRCISNVECCPTCRKPIDAACKVLPPPPCMDDAVERRPYRSLRKLAMVVQLVRAALYANPDAVIAVLTPHAGSAVAELRSTLPQVRVLQANNADDVFQVLCGINGVVVVVPLHDATAASVPATHVIVMTPPIFDAEHECLRRYTRHVSANNVQVDVLYTADTLEERVKDMFVERRTVAAPQLTQVTVENILFA